MLDAIEENLLPAIMQLAVARALIHGTVIMSRRQRLRQPALAREDAVRKLYRQESQRHRHYRVS